MSREEIVSHQAREQTFASTPIGAAFLKFKNAHARAWIQDTEDNFTDRDRKSTKDAWDRATEAERELRALIDN